MLRTLLVTTLACLTACASSTRNDDAALATRSADQAADTSIERPGATPAAPAIATTLDGFAWMAGRWVSEQDGEYLEESWGEPAGNVLLGTFRWLRGGDAWLYEFMLIEELPEGVVFHLRHFGPEHMAWEPQDAPLSYPLLSQRDGEAVFENVGRDDPRRFVYRRTGDVMEIRLESADGSAQSYSFRLAPPGAATAGER